MRFFAALAFARRARSSFLEAIVVAVRLLEKGVVSTVHIKVRHFAVFY